MKRPDVSYSLDPTTSSFVIENYNWAPPSSDFFPGVAGKWGIPLWIYYVNRGQALSSMGVRDKDGQILEFYSFNKAVMRVEREVFRTFLRIDGGTTHEPFRKTDQAGIRQKMCISAAELTIQEQNDSLQVEVDVSYFPLPNLPVAALARVVRIRNLSSDVRRVEWVDGVARIIPFGLDLNRIKSIPRHIEGMMEVVDFRGVPLFRLKQRPEDIERVAPLVGGNFYASPGATLGNGLVVDPEAVFGEEMNLDRPWRFEASGAAGVLNGPDFREAKTPCAFVVRTDDLAAHGEVLHVSLLGHVARDEDLLALLSALRKPGFLETKQQENTEVIGEISNHCFTVSSSPHFDAYAGQNFLDSVLRGGIPLVFDTAHGKSVCHLYWRRHGDLERDYHHFVVEPTYLSQGNGFYRDVLQNRRCDSWFYPEVEDANLLAFINLIQLDGYNPLGVRGVTYRIEDEAGVREWLRKHVKSKPLRADLLRFLCESFTPGELAMRLESVTRGRRQDRERALREILMFCRENEIGELHEGFWSDHWTYNLDLLEMVLAVFPDRLGAFFIEGRNYTFFDNPDIVLPRDEKTVDTGSQVRCYGAVVRDPEKERRIHARKVDAYTVRTRYGKGRIYHTNLMAKLLCMVTNRLATLDPAGIGIEMEASKPGWNDALQGLPGLFGSGLSESIELRRAIRILLAALERLDLPETKTLQVHEELASFVRALGRIMEKRLSSRSRDAAFHYWDEANTTKERYRNKTKFGVSGREAALSVGQLRDFLLRGNALLESAVAGPMRPRVFSPEGVPYTYFVNEVAKHRPLGRTSHLGYPLVKPLAFRQYPVKLFLEGSVHWMKDRPEEARAIYAAVRRSEIYDRKLKMYKTCEDVTSESPELGRAVGSYPRGWLENESIYLHMHYKYLLEILRAGMCSEFWKEARTGLVPFMKPEVYGRSTLEGASFIVSSAYPDARLHGRAFQPRLSGMTIEFISMWILAVAGDGPFRLGEKGELELILRPRLPASLFTTEACVRRYHDPAQGWRDLKVPKNAFAFKLLGRVLVVYRNEARRPTYGPRGVKPVEYRLYYRDGRVVRHKGESVGLPHSEAIRRGAIERISVTLK